MHSVSSAARAAVATHSPGLSSLPGGHCYPLRSSLRWDGLLLSQGEAVIMMDALRAITFFGAFCGNTVFRVTATSGPCNGPRGAGNAAGDEEPATKSRASTYQQCRKRYQGDGASGTDMREWSRARSTVSNLQRTGDQRGAPGY